LPSFAGSDSRRSQVGELAQNRRGVYFQYDADYLREHPSLSPFNLPVDGALRQAPSSRSPKAARPVLSSRRGA